MTLHIPRGRQARARRRERRGQDDAHQAAHAPLRAHRRGAFCSTGSTSRNGSPRRCARAIGVIFQDFIRYQLIVGENIGAGDVDAFDDEARWRARAEKGMADPFVERLPQRLRNAARAMVQGRQELSIGQWQKIALSRAFMREHADILVLDEPTAAMDAEAEAEVFQRFRSLADNRMGIVISHRFSTVRMADRNRRARGRRDRRARHARRADGEERPLRAALQSAGRGLSVGYVLRALRPPVVEFSVG